MNINLYQTKDEVHKINKTLSNQNTLTGTLKNETNILSPTVIVEIENPTIYNYCNIPEFGDRYYFINEYRCIRQGIWEIDLKIDVLYTYRNSILNQVAIVSKQENNITKYYNDGSYGMNCQRKNQVYNFPNGFNQDAQFCLIVAGGNEAQVN